MNYIYINLYQSISIYMIMNNMNKITNLGIHINYKPIILMVLYLLMLDNLIIVILVQ